MRKALALAAAASLLLSLTGCAGVAKEDRAGCDTYWNDYLKMLQYYPKAGIKDGSLTANQAVTYMAAMQVYAQKVTEASKTVKAKELRESLNALASSVSAMQAEFQLHPLASDKQIVASFTASQDVVDAYCRANGWKPASLLK